MLSPFDSLQVNTIFHHLPQWAVKEQINKDEDFGILFDIRVIYRR